MGLKDLKSKLDLNGGFGNEGGTLGEMDNFTPQNFQLDKEAADLKHIASLTEKASYQHGDSVAKMNPSTLDLNAIDGGNGKFDKGRDNTLHQDSLVKLYKYSYGGGNFPESKEIAGPVPGGYSNSPFQDLNGADGGNGKFDKGRDNTLHVDSLKERQYQYNHGGTPGMAGPVKSDSPYQDLNTTQNGTGDARFFDKGRDNMMHQDSLLKRYRYSHGSSVTTAGPVPGGDSNSPFQDMDGEGPIGYTNPDTGNTF